MSSEEHKRILDALYSDDMAYRSGPMLNPKLFEEFYRDTFRRITETAHPLGMIV